MNHHCVTRPGDYGPVTVAARRPEELLALIHDVGSVRELELTTRLDVDSIFISISAEERAEMERAVPPETWREMEALFADIEGGEARREMQEQARLLAMTPARRVLGEVKAPATARIAVEELRGGLDQIIIWGYHVEALRRVVADMEKAGVRVALLNGSTPGHHRRHHVDAFTTKNLQALVCNLEVAGTGLDGLQCSHRALLMEPDWLPGVNAQAIARQYRQGQQHPVHVSLIVVARSPDEAVSRVLERRTRMITKSTGAAV
jgi:SNF2 family DNA or RNA helicase